MRASLGALAGLVLLAGCEDATIISHVFRAPNMRLVDFQSMQAHGGVPTEIHGAPFPGAAPAEVAAATEGPAGAARIRFRATPIEGPSAHGRRLVLHFNPTGAPNGPEDCARTEEARTIAPGSQGFTVTMTVCDGDEMDARGYLQAPGVAAGDWQGYTEAMRELFLAVFRKENDR